MQTTETPDEAKMRDINLLYGLGYLKAIGADMPESMHRRKKWSITRGAFNACYRQGYRDGARSCD